MIDYPVRLCRNLPFMRRTSGAFKSLSQTQTKKKRPFHVIELLIGFLTGFQTTFDGYTIQYKRPEKTRYPRTSHLPFSGLWCLAAGESCGNRKSDTLYPVLCAFRD